MTASIIVPAFNIKPALAKKFEEDIAKVMHRTVAKEREKKTHDEHKENPNKKRTGATLGRPNNETDELILKVIQERALTVSDIADRIGRQRDTVRMALDRLLARGQVRKITGEKLNRWAVAENQEEQAKIPHDKGPEE